MTNPKNQWYGGNYNDAFWHGFGQGAAAGSAVVAMAGIPDAIAKIGKALSGVEGWTLDWITTFSKSSYDNLSPIVKDVVKYGDMLISNKGSTNQFLTKWAGSVNPFTNDYLKEFYDITVGNAYDMYTGQTRDIYKLYFTSATQVWAGKYIDASIPLTETDEEDTNPLGKKNINNFLKGTFNDAASSLINNGRISGSSVIGAGFSAANPLIISISVGTKEYPVFYESIPPDLRL
jgi:hypothetical protein